MLKVLTLVLLLASGSAVAEEVSPFNGRHVVKPIVYTECHAGKLVIIAASTNGVALMQLFEDRDEMVPKPMECKDDKNETEER